MKIFKKIISLCVLMQCIGIIILYSMIGLIRVRFVKDRERFANTYLRKGSIKILKKMKVNYRITFAEELNQIQEPPYVFMSNHLSLIDLPLIYATFFGSIRPLPKKSLFKIPIFGSVLRAAGLVPIDKDHPDHMLKLFSELKTQHKNITWWWIFPEGTRSRNGELLPFKLGGFRFARELGAKIIPVGISGTQKVLAAHAIDLNLHQSIQIKVGKPIDTRDYQSVLSQKELVAHVAEAIKALTT